MIFDNDDLSTTNIICLVALNMGILIVKKSKNKQSQLFLISAIMFLVKQ